MAVMPQEKGEDRGPPPPGGLSFAQDASLSGLEGLEESDPLPWPSRNNFLLREEVLRLSCTWSQSSSDKQYAAARDIVRQKETIRKRSRDRGREIHGERENPGERERFQ